MYNWDHLPVEVAVLEAVQGPYAGEAYPPGHPLHEPEPPSRVEWLANAYAGMILSEKLPAGIQVRIEGFKRPELLSGRIRNSRTGNWDVARETPRLPGQPPKKTSRFPMIKVRRIYEILPNGKERLVWKTDVPFKQL